MDLPFQVKFLEFGLKGEYGYSIGL